jgi:uncharacterized membrane protein YdcZ (DUF606 family)
LINISLFAFHEQFWSSLVKWPSWLFPTALSLACFVALKKLSAPRLAICLIVAVCVCALLVVTNKDGPNAVLLKLFGVHLPVFTLFTILAPGLVLVAVAFEIILKQNLISKSVAVLLTLLLVSLNIELLSGISSATFRAQDYANKAESASFIFGKASAMAMCLALPPLMAGASRQLLSGHRSWIVTLVCFVSALISSIWICKVYLVRIFQNVMLLYS